MRWNRRTFVIVALAFNLPVWLALVPLAIGHTLAIGVAIAIAAL